MEGARISAAHVAHVPVLTTIHGECFDDGWDNEAFLRLLVQPGVSALIASARDADPLGFIMVRAAADEAEILTLGVRNAVRREGIAAALLNEAMALLKANGAVRLILEVACDNPGAIRFYAALDFAEVGRRPGYYRRSDGRIDALVMALDL